MIFGRPQQHRLQRQPVVPQVQVQLPVRPVVLLPQVRVPLRRPVVPRQLQLRN